MKSNASIIIDGRLGCGIGFLCACVLSAVGPFVATSAAQSGSSHVLEIIESGESATPIVTYDGNPVGVTGTMLKDNWTLVFPSEFDLVPGTINLGEPEDGTKYNKIVIQNVLPVTLTWQSDITKPAGVGSLQSTITLGGVGDFTPEGPNSSPQIFDLKLVDQVPDRSSTAGLLGLALLGLLGSVRMLPIDKAQIS